MWLHVDACWGGSVVFSKKLKHLMAGSDKVDSIAWNPHKMVGAPLQTSAFIVRHKGDHWHIFIDQCQWTMLKLTSRIGLSMNIRNFFKFQRTFSSNWKIKTPAQEQCAVSFKQ